MNAIDKVIAFIESAMLRNEAVVPFNNATVWDHRYSVTSDKGGHTVILDQIYRIKVVISVNTITVTKYSTETGKLLHTIDIQWDDLSIPQRKKLIELMDSADDALDPEIEETLKQIFE
jgi:hypothetical protein